MKALRYIGNRMLEIHEIPVPLPKEEEVLIKVSACGICGSDVHGYLGLTGRRLPPMTMGHEFCGEIKACGQKATKFSIDDKVIIQPINFCGECINCKRGLTMLCLNKKFLGVLDVDGAMAEYISVPEKLIYRRPDTCSAHIGAMTEPFAVAYGGIKKAGDLSGKTVLIIGSGMIGLCILQLLRFKNPSIRKIIVSDLSDARLQKARSVGADEVINPRKENFYDAVNKLTDGEMVDVSIEAVGVEASANQAIQCLKVGGKTIWAGMSQTVMNINMQDIVCSARSIIGTFNYTHKEFGEVVQIMASGKMVTDNLISKTVTLEGAIEVFEELHMHPDDYIKVIIDMTI